MTKTKDAATVTTPVTPIRELRSQAKELEKKLVGVRQSIATHPTTIKAAVQDIPFNPVFAKLRSVEKVSGTVDGIYGATYQGIRFKLGRVNYIARVSQPRAGQQVVEVGAESDATFNEIRVGFPADCEDPVAALLVDLTEEQAVGLALLKNAEMV